MKKIIKSTLLLVCVMAFSFTTVNAQKATENALLWKVEGNELTEPSYLFGTIHLICAEEFVMEDKVVDIIGEVDKVALEIDMDDPQMMMKMQQLMVNPGMKNIRESMTEEETELVENYLKSNFGQGLDQLGILKPFAINSMLITSALTCQIKQYEAEIMQLAKENEKEIVGLETIEFQISLFDAIDFDKQVDQLVEAIQNPDYTKTMMDELVSAYTAKDVDELWEVLEQYEEYEDFNEKFLFQRNRNWIKEIESYSKEGSVLYAVGAGHLLSDEGVIALLRAKGYTVTPVEL